MTDKCKELEKKAKGVEKEDPKEAINLYKEASQCFAQHDNTKNKNSNLEKAAKLFKELGKSTEDPTNALDEYEESASIYTEIGKEGDAEKVMQEAFQKFITAAKSINAEARKMDIADAAEQKFKLAAGYASLGMDDALSNKCWIDSGDQYYKEAKMIENPREAFESFKHAILNYTKGNATEKFDLLLTDAAEKFNKKGTEISKTKKTIVLAIDKFLQVENIYRYIGSESKSEESDQKIQVLCERIGMVKDSIILYLESQGMIAVSFSDLTHPSPLPEKEDLSAPISDVEPLTTDIKPEEDPIPSFPEEIPEIEKKIEPEISTPEISQPIPELVTDEIEVEIDTKPTIEAFIDELDPLETSKDPTTPEVLSEQEESVDIRPVKHGIPEARSKLEADDSEEVPTFEAPTEEIDPIETIQTPQTPVEEPIFEAPTDKIDPIETIQTPATPTVIPEKKESLDPRPVKHGIPGPTVKLDTEGPEEQSTFEAPREEIDPIETIQTPTAPVEEPTFEAPTDKIDPVETIQTPTTPDDISELEESFDPRPVKHGVPGPTLKFEAEDLKDEVSIETPLDMPVDDLDKPELDKPEIEQPKDILSREVVSDIEEKYEPVVVKEEIVESPQKFDPREVKEEIQVGLKPMAPMKEIDKSEIEEPEISSTPEVDDYLKERFNPDSIKDEIPEELKFIQKTGDIATISESIIKILRDQGYINDTVTKNMELLQVPEYQILLFLINNHPIPLEEIEEKTDVSSISLVLSNLQADGLIEQTNDYQWTISQKVKDSRI